MKIILSAFAFIILIFSISACQKELDWGGDNLANPNPDSTSTDPVNVAKCTDCLYQPICNDVTYTWQITTTGGVSERNDKYKIIADTTINGKKYKRINYTAGQPDSYVSCDNQVLAAYGNNIATTTGNVNVDLIMLKANENEGATWTSTIKNPANQDVLYTFRIEEKNVNYTVLGKNYPNVIHVSTDMSIGGISAGTAHYYYAKGIGLIASTIESLGTETYRQELKSYNIP